MKNSDVEYDTEYLTNEDSNEQDFNFDENNQTSVLESIVDPETNSSKTLANEQDFKEYDTEHITNEANNHDVDENNLEHLKAPKEKHPKTNTNTKNSDEEYNTEYLTDEDSNQQDFNFDKNNQTSILESIVDPETNSSNLLDGPQEKNIKEKKTRSKRYRKMKIEANEPNERHRKKPEFFESPLFNKKKPKQSKKCPPPKCPHCNVRFNSPTYHMRHLESCRN